ncbi:hypothetical protein BT96DRAFT_887142 [Gymnopus androsaceus JB14]|uniref:F-box domain-containing protein n=1 Tax=Gymnopus androsaceus JB14 TaxID=1447944 RepID=A0A6A4H8Y0_9AGAR|nr:hypothetical protein BT96DRAFT_887142 [Gymnopus androsaceus JB14]
MTRRSLRLQDKQNDSEARSSKHPRSDNEEEEDEEYQNPPRKVKKRAKKRPSNGESSSAVSKRKKMPKEFKGVRGKFGLLEKLAKDAPLDIFFEIFTHLQPDDLLRLARTSKDLRGILLRKSTESIWRTARSNVEGLPPLPDDMSEPQYAHLLFFDTYCHNCLSKRKCEKVLWVFRTRCCKTCASQLFTTWNDVKISLNLDDRLVDAIPYLFISGADIGKRPQYMAYRMVQASTVATYNAEFDALASNEEQVAWLDRMKQVQEMYAKHAALHLQWHSSREVTRNEERRAIITERKADILNRLGKLGWREEAEFIICPWDWDNFSKHKLVNPKQETHRSRLEQHSESRASRNVNQTQTGPTFSTRMREFFFGSFCCLCVSLGQNIEC